MNKGSPKEMVSVRIPSELNKKFGEFVKAQGVSNWTVFFQNKDKESKKQKRK